MSTNDNIVSSDTIATSSSSKTPSTTPSTNNNSQTKTKPKREAPWKEKYRKKKERRQQKNVTKLEEGRKNYESKSKGYSVTANDGTVLSENAPHPGSYAYQEYVERKLREKEGGEKKEVEKDGEDTLETNRKYPKRKLAFLVGFCGKNYQGMQMNENSVTIQAELERAFYLSELLSPANYGYPKKCGWSNSARTDKGVHAAAQVISARVNVPTPGEDLLALIDLVNSNLPQDVRVLDVKRVTKGFCAKTARDKVRYQYMVPTYCLREDLQEAMDGILGEKKGRFRGGFETLEEETKDKLQKAMTSYRTDEKVLEKTARIFANYKGTKKYHNYTNRLSYTDASASRYMHDFSPVSTGVVYGPDGMEWLGVRVTGQAFLLHQIRKMVSMAVDVVRGAAGEDAMEKSFGAGKMRLSIAPSQGLFLDMSYFDHYCDRSEFKYDLLRWGGDGDQSEATKRWADFKRTKIVDHMLAEEEKERNFLAYMYNQIYLFPQGGDAYVLFEGMKAGGDIDEAVKSIVKETANTEGGA